MDNRSFISQLAKKSGFDTKETAQLARSFSSLLSRCIADSEDVAIPGFGTFESIKTAERVVRDRESGSARLIPPSIRTGFRTGSRLKKSLGKL